MRLVAAMFKHETNTFSPVPTPLRRFGDGGPYFGNAARDAYRGTDTPLGAFIALAEARDAALDVPVAAEAWPSGPVEDDAFETVAGRILAAVERGCDALLLDLHGAMVTRSHDDGEGELLGRVRRLVPGLPIAVALDFHANVTEAMVKNATAIAGYKTYPHLDMRETGERVGRIVLDALDRNLRPVMRWGNRPMIPHILRQATEDEPMRGLVAASRAAESKGMLAVTVFGGFPHADIREAGLSVVTVADGDAAGAAAARDRLLDRAWDARADFVYRGEALEKSVARAKQLGAAPGEGPVVLLDHCDNCGSGGTQDVMDVIAEVMRQNLQDVVAFAVCDPQAVARMAEAGVGARVKLALGGKLDMPSIGLKGKPLHVEGIVRLIGDGSFVVRGPMYTGVRVAMGKSCVLDTGGVEIAVTERNHEPWDPGCLRSLGIEPRAKRFVLLKSRVHWRAGFKPIARAAVECAGRGVTTSDYAILNFKKLRRPIYPLDQGAAPH